MEDTLKEIIKTTKETLENALSAGVVAVPKQVCTCGKPVVFINPRKTFEYT